MCTNYNTLHERCVTKYQIIWHNSNIYICTGEHDDNIIFLHEIDWKIQLNDRHMSLMLLATLKIVSCLKKYYNSDDDTTDIVKLLCLPTHSINYFGWVWISGTITVWYMYWTNNKLHIPKWILRKMNKFHTNILR